MAESLEMVRRQAVCAARGRGVTAHYADIRLGLFTPPVKVGARASAWPRHELEAINAARLAGKSDDEIRELVRKLVEQRRVAA